ncbi:MULTISPECIES: DUF4176 domain-containing protein [Bacillus]|uniref:DUF4176 domain-containing protein n=1 Tax=Bacillus TaxID=1386 RepID=UPI0005A489FF|nr:MULTISPECIES: DUF4176 domain-containing protein [Bacillus]MBW4825661.1 DUF4176 domain-containing protein [Bacillaceae bacterium]MUG01332.1 DUF4176 domain-containing protein [Bacillus tequilensis]AJO60296.1 hypothetical protein QF06_18110 [Bacillus sp. YP1]AOA56728.1 hypothetical protein BSHJ0_04185 [Bacillus subtilis]ASC01495.1 hypothetical protein CD007_20030 [Bacillus subtilis]
MSRIRNWFPIGTIVKLKNMKKLVMVFGRHQIQSSSGKEFDYVAVPYPEGNISENFNVFFDEEMIEKVIYEGYTDNEDQLLRDKLNEIIEEEK